LPAKINSREEYHIWNDIIICKHQSFTQKCSRPYICSHVTFTCVC